MATSNCNDARHDVLESRAARPEKRRRELRDVVPVPSPAPPAREQKERGALLAIGGGVGSEDVKRIKFFWIASTSQHPTSVGTK